MENPFDKLTKIPDSAREKLFEYGKLLREANEKVNLLSRKDTDDLEYRHIAFCAAISEFFSPRQGASIADVGTGGGLPGVVMAVLYPQARVSMFDGVGKKIEVVNSIIEKLDLRNARAFHQRVEEQKSTFDYVCGRSVCNLPQFFGFVKNKIRFGRAGNLTNGVIYFKGGELESELLAKKVLPDAVFDLEKFFGDERFAAKTISHFDVSKVVKF